MWGDRRSKTFYELLARDKEIVKVVLLLTGSIEGTKLQARPRARLASVVVAVDVDASQKPSPFPFRKILSCSLSQPRHLRSKAGVACALLLPPPGVPSILFMCLSRVVPMRLSRRFAFTDSG